MMCILGVFVNFSKTLEDEPYTKSCENARLELFIVILLNACIHYILVIHTDHCSVGHMNEYKEMCVVER
jgi:hypothetical protein